YREAKERHPGMLLLFRMGDFYELFDADAETASRVLGLTLTSRDKTIPMAGFPHHALDNHLRKLLHAGHRVAICDQVEDPALAEELGRLAPSECLCGERDPGRLVEQLREGAPPSPYPLPPRAGGEGRVRGAMAVTQRPDWTFDPATARAALFNHFGVTTLAGFGFDDTQPCLVAAGALLLYLQETLKASL